MAVQATTDCVRGCNVAADDERTVFVAAAAAGGGLLCDRCLAKLGWLLDDISDVAARARLAVVPGLGASTGGGEKVSGSKDPGLPLNAAAMDTCDLLVSVMAEWVAYWARTLHAVPPAALAAAVKHDRDVSGVRAGTTPEAVADGLIEWALWVKVRLDVIARHRGVADCVNDLATVVGSALKQFPRDEEREVQPQRPRYCPVCGERRVWVSWPRQSVDPVVKCGDCEWVFETEWEELKSAIGIS